METKVDDIDRCLVGLPKGHQNQTSVRYEDVSCQQCGKEDRVVRVIGKYTERGPVLTPAGWLFHVGIDRGYESGDEELEFDEGYCSRECLVAHYHSVEEKRLVDVAAAEAKAAERENATQRRQFEMLAKKFLGAEGESIVERLKKEGK
jgi:hypothetical protein